MSIFDGLMNPAQVGGAFTAGLEHGQKQREDREVKGALSAYAINPDDETAFQTLAQYKPEMAIQIGQDRQKRQQATQMADLQSRAAGGDKAALQQLAGSNLDAWSKLDGVARDKIKARGDYAGQAALAVLNLPPEQRSAAWDDYAREGVNQGFEELGQFIGQYSQEKANSAIAQAGLVKELEAMTEPDTINLQLGGSVAERDPLTGIYKEVFRSNPGDKTPFSPVDTSAAPTPGSVVGGYKFKGGNPKDRNNWEPSAKGGAGSGQPTFQQ